MGRVCVCVCVCVCARLFVYGGPKGRLSRLMPSSVTNVLSSLRNVLSSLRNVLSSLTNVVSRTFLEVIKASIKVKGYHAYHEQVAS